jgi:hypothetical protein
MARFQWSDAWLLHAVCMASGGKGAKLSSVVAAADYINHAILTTAEIRGGLFRLVAADHVAVRDTQIRARGGALKLWKEKTTKRRAIHTLQRSFEEFLGVESGTGAPNDTGTMWPTEADVQEACQEYQAMAEDALSRRAGR